MSNQTTRRIVLCLVTAGLAVGAACGGSDAPAVQKGVVDVVDPSTTTVPPTTEAPPTTAAKPTTTTTEAPTPTTAQPTSSGLSFANCTEAKAAGYKNIQRGAPGYSEDLDRDGDGFACES